MLVKLKPSQQWSVCLKRTHLRYRSKHPSLLQCSTSAVVGKAVVVAVVASRV